MEGESEKLGGVWHLVLANIRLAPGTVLYSICKIFVCTLLICLGATKFESLFWNGLSQKNEQVY